MRILFVSEGRHELGLGLESGAVVELFRRLATVADFEFERLQVSDRRVRVHRERGKSGAPYRKRALAWLRYAEREQFDALVLLIDRDRDKQRTSGIDAAHDSDSPRLPRAMGVAVETFDAWFLADEGAFGRVVGRTIDRQKRSEALKNPKALVRSLVDESQGGLGLAEFYLCAVAELDLPEVEKRCPMGFAPFAQRVRALGLS
jgi:hypothetical protein